MSSNLNLKAGLDLFLNFLAYKTQSNYYLRINFLINLKKFIMKAEIFALIFNIYRNKYHGTSIKFQSMAHFKFYITLLILL